MSKNWVLLTGASRGIGKAVALSFAEKKSSLLLIARDMEKLNLVKKECLEKGATEVYCFKVDLRSEAEINEFFKNNVSLLQKVTVLINNAGLALGLNFFQDSSASQHKEMMDVNLSAPIQFTHKMLPYFLQKNEGHIINLGSVAGTWIYPKGHVYCATKAAMKAFSEALRLDLNGSKIRVSEISPGMVESDFSRTRFSGDEEKAKKVYEGMSPLTPEDIAETILWICQRPKHVNIQECVIYPTDQANPTTVSRKSK